MALSKIDLCNQALLKVGAETIASLDINQNDSDPVIQSAKLCNILFSQALEEVLRSYRWNSATKRVQLTQLSTTPSFKWKFQYQLPNDCIRVVNAYETTDAIDDGTTYVIEGKTLLTDYNTVFLLYIYNPEDLSVLDPLLRKCIIQNLAIKLSVPLQLDLKMQNNLIEEYNATILPEARSVDTLENKYWDMEEGNWITSRYNNSPII
jgi:hypothetical protein